jgi:hypothetical protein
MKDYLLWKTSPIAKGTPMNHARTRNRNLVHVLVVAASLAGSSGCRPAGTEKGKTQPRIVSVAVLAPTQTTMERTTTQPATVHAYYEASLYAKASGYLTDLKVDIGKSTLGHPSRRVTCWP